MAEQNILPDPDYAVKASGAEGTVGVDYSGQPFKSIKLDLIDNNTISRGLAGNTIQRGNTNFSWKISIKYNPLTEAQFYPIYNFLAEKRGSLKPFYVSLPHYKTPYYTTYSGSFAEYVYNSGTPIDIPTDNAIAAGDSYVSLDTTGKYPARGDVFNIVDDTNTKEQGAYVVTRVEYNGFYDSSEHPGSNPSVGTMRVHCVPRIKNICSVWDDVSSGAKARFHNPLFYVRQVGDIQKFSLNKNNLYSFGIELEEAT